MTGQCAYRRTRSETEPSIQRATALRLKVWRQQPPSFFKEAVIEADGTIVETTGKCKEGMHISCNGKWGYHPLVVSLANTQEVLFIENRPANRPSEEGVSLALRKRLFAALRARQCKGLAARELACEDELLEELAHGVADRDGIGIGVGAHGGWRGKLPSLWCLRRSMRQGQELPDALIVPWTPRSVGHEAHREQSRQRRIDVLAAQAERFGHSLPTVE
jgi:hypothetical protein